MISEERTSTIEKIRILKEQLENIIKNEQQNSIKYNRIQEMQFGEKPSKYFLNLEKQRSVEKTFIRLIDQNNCLIDRQEDILQEVFLYFKDLYTFKPVSEAERLFAMIPSNKVCRFTPQESEVLEGDICYSEILDAVKQIKIGKAPGQDGFTAEFLKYFINDIGFFLLRRVKNAYLTGELSPSQNLGLITLIPKGNKPRHFIKNWRPISLLNVVYKIVSTCLANRLRKVLSVVIHTDQKGFLPGRFIGKNIRMIYDIIALVEKQNLSCTLMLLDFEKAFDSISHAFIQKVLSFFGVGPSCTVMLTQASLLILNCHTDLTFKGAVNKGIQFLLTFSLCV